MFNIWCVGVSNTISTLSLVSSIIRYLVFILSLKDAKGSNPQTSSFVMASDDRINPKESSNRSQSSLLLHLPLEVFQLIAYHMDAATFFTSLLTCKYFLTSASESRRNLLRHLNRLPGLQLGFDQLENVDLLKEFRKRAAESALGAETLADRSTWKKEVGRTLATAVFTSEISLSNDPPYLATGKYDSGHDFPICSPCLIMYDEFEMSLCVLPETTEGKAFDGVRRWTFEKSRLIAVSLLKRPHRRRRRYCHLMWFQADRKINTYMFSL